MRKMVSAVVAFVLAGAPVLANDSEAELAAGGLVLQKTYDIEMKSEDLSISAERVRVKYQFLNSSSQDILTVIAFPLPDITVEQDANMAVPSAGTDNFLDFSTSVDGKPVKMTLEQKVFARGVDQTSLIRDLQLPRSPLVAGEALDRLDPKAKEELINLGLAQNSRHRRRQRDGASPSSAMDTQDHVLLDATFPAKTVLNAEHKYISSVGGSVGTTIGLPSIDPETLTYYKTRYCTDASFIAAARAKNNAFTEEWISYVLTTGANWAKPIGTFTLTVDKGAPLNF